ncbi:MAG: hypothetical protein HY319_00420 [Armatimonadetes bacterium]|nr:hypothetical protein [Armatimonadota bacterium]
MITELSDFLQDAARCLKRGDQLDAEAIRKTAEEIHQRLEEVCAEAEARPSPPGLEGLDEALFEAAELFYEAVTLLVMAVEEDIPELASVVSERAQDAVDTLKALEQTVETQCTMIGEETPTWE